MREKILKEMPAKHSLEMVQKLREKKTTSVEQISKFNYPYFYFKSVSIQDD